MEIKNNKEELPFSHYEGLFAQAEAAEISARLPHSGFDGAAFHVTLLGTEYTLTHPQFTCAPAAPLPVQTFLLRYLLEGKELPWHGTWKTFREMPWGELYIKPYTGRVLTRAAFTFGTRLDAFRRGAEALGAKAISHGDAGYEFQFLGQYRMQLMAWEGDDEFPPNAQVLYSDNFEEGFAPEDRVVAGDILISAVKALMG